MSYALSPYLIDLQTLRAAVGGKDRDLIQRVIEDDPDAFDEPVEKDEIPLKQALTDLIMGNRMVAGSAHQYGYALEHLCRHLGESLDCGYWDAVRWNAVEATGMDGILEDMGSPVPLPVIRDFPAIGHVHVSELESELQTIRDQRTDNDDEDLDDLFPDCLGWFEEAIQRKMSLMFFYY